MRSTVLRSLMLVAGASILLSAASAAFAFVFRDSTLTITDVAVRFLSPEFAVAHVRWTMTGARTPPGIPEPREGIQTQTLRKAAGKWLIEAFQNTNAAAEAPFPLGMPAGAASPSPKP